MVGGGPGSEEGEQLGQEVVHLSMSGHDLVAEAGSSVAVVEGSPVAVTEGSHLAVEEKS